MTDFIYNFLGIAADIQAKLFYTALVFTLLIMMRSLILRIAFKKFANEGNYYQWKKVTTYINTVLIVLLISRIWLGLFSDLGTFLGLVSAGIAIALQDLLVNMVGWGFILIRKPFKVGDRIEVGTVKGDVIDIRLFQFSVLEVGGWVEAEQSTGRILHVPNGIVFKQPQANYTEGFRYIWEEIKVLITFESDWKKARSILNDIISRMPPVDENEAGKQIKETAKKFVIQYNNLTPKVFLTVKDSGVLLSLRFLCEPNQRRLVDERIWEAILDEFGKHSDIDFAYPTTRFYNNEREGKKATNSDGESSTERV